MGGENLTELVRRRVVVHGLVHGVGFRASCARRAQALGLSGSVRNCPEGTVEAVFEGSVPAVAEMVEWCRSGPALARVSDIEVSEEPPRRGNGFIVA